MTNLYRIENSIFESNTFIVWDSESKLCMVVDCGDTEAIMRFIEANSLEIDSLLLTHGHFDHIYGLNLLVKNFPEIKIYASEYAIRELYDVKLNYSAYHEAPYVYEGDKRFLVPINDGQLLPMFDGRMNVECIATPGHESGCMTFILGDYIFTGDSYIPGIRTVTNLRGNKQQAKESEAKIKAMVAERGLIVCPGHGDIANGLLTSL